ncbi:MAG: hypothetical protein QM537_06100, partial [Candidatus Symbiobacter sp.]|nr:hypothetical protein [Candidatus Symbiobacter sp.]
ESGGNFILSPLSLTRRPVLHGYFVSGNPPGILRNNPPAGNDAPFREGLNKSFSTEPRLCDGERSEAGSNPEKSSNFKMLLDCFAGEAARSQMPFFLFLRLVRSILKESLNKSSFTPPSLEGGDS